YEVYFSVPQDKDNKRVQSIVKIGATYMHTPIDRRGMNPLNDFKLIKSYNKIIRDINPDIILTYTIKPNIYGSYVANKFKIPVIMNITGLGTSLVSGRLKSFIKSLYKYAGNKSETVFFQNESNREFFIINGLVRENKTQLIPGSGVNIERFLPDSKSDHKSTMNLLFIGRVMKEKGIEEFLSTASSLSTKYKNIEFQILGFFEEEKYKKIIEENTNSNIKYLGVSSDVRNEIRNADCVVNPSYHEGMSNVLLESAAMGKPLLASNIPGCKEIIDDGCNGFLFESQSVDSLEKTVVKLIELNPDQRDRMGKKSREKAVKEFDRQIVVNKYLK